MSRNLAESDRVVKLKSFPLSSIQALSDGYLALFISTLSHF